MVTKKMEFTALFIMALFIMGLLIMALSTVSCANGTMPDISSGSSNDDYGGTENETTETADSYNETNNEQETENPEEEETTPKDEPSENEPEHGLPTDNPDFNEAGDNPSPVPDTTLKTIAEISAYLAEQTDGADADNPIYLAIELDLSTMQANSNWPTLLGVLFSQGKFVELNLSRCSITNNIFSPRSVLSKNGKDKIVSLVLPDTTESIPNGVSNSVGAFSGFTNLTSVSFPETLASIGSYSFAYCTRLTDLIFNSPKPPTLGITVFYGVYPTPFFHVPPESLYAYQTALNWIIYENHIIPHAD